MLGARRHADLDRAAAADDQALLAAERRGNEVDLEPIAAIGAALRLARGRRSGSLTRADRRSGTRRDRGFPNASPKPRPNAAAEHLAEDGSRRRLAGRPRNSKPPNAWRGRPSASISPRSNLRALCGVGQQVIGLADLLEALLGPGAARIAVGVQHLGELAIGLLDRGLVGAARHVQGAVGVHHRVRFPMRRGLLGILRRNGTVEGASKQGDRERERRAAAARDHRILAVMQRDPVQRKVAPQRSR